MTEPAGWVCAWAASMSRSAWPLALASAHGMMVRAEGVFEAKVLSKEEADHLESDGAGIVRNPDGTVTELGFIAAGVELWRPRPAPKTSDKETDRS